MEPKSEKTAGGWDAGARQLNDLSGRAFLAMTELYKRQLSMAFDFYNNLFNLTLNAGNGSRKSFFDANALWNSDGRSAFSFFSPFRGLWPEENLYRLTTDGYKKFASLALESNREMMNTLMGSLQTGQEEHDSLGDTYRRLIEDEMEAAKSMIMTMNEAYIRQVDLLFEINKKAFADLSQQINRVLNSNQGLWNIASKTGNEEVRTAKTEKPATREVLK